MALEVFNRFEHKYLMDNDMFQHIQAIMDKYMVPDRYCQNHGCYTIANIYYDTPDDRLIRESLSKPVYKEKLRLRSYGVPDLNSDVFLEIKKKFNGLVNKRRTTLKLYEAYDFLATGEAPVFREYMNGQVLHELEYFLSLYNLLPKVYIAYDRIAYFENGNDDLRISFDKNIRTRRGDLRLEAGDFGKKLLPDGVWLMEIKTSRSMPIWLCDMLAEFDLKKVSFSKYGTEFKNSLNNVPHRKKIYEFSAQKAV